MEATLLERIKEQLVRHAGLRLRPYRCTAGKLTIGIGGKSVLLKMCFNLGIGGLLEFNNTLAFIAAGDWERAANGMLASKWAKQVGRRAIELSELMRKGK